eukprot:6176973-Pleurochrysis_carterae.AAC.6
MQNGFARHTEVVPGVYAGRASHIWLYYGNLCNVCVVPRWCATNRGVAYEAAHVVFAEDKALVKTSYPYCHASLQGTSSSSTTNDLLPTATTCRTAAFKGA